MMKAISSAEVMPPDIIQAFTSRLMKSDFRLTVCSCSDRSHDRTDAERDERIDDGKVEPQFMPPVQDADRSVDQRVDRHGHQQGAVQTKDYGLEMPKAHSEAAAKRPG